MCRGGTSSEGCTAACLLLLASLPEICNLADPSVIESYSCYQKADTYRPLLIRSAIELRNVVCRQRLGVKLEISTSPQCLCLTTSPHPTFQQLLGVKSKHFCVCLSISHTRTLLGYDTTSQRVSICYVHCLSSVDIRVPVVFVCDMSFAFLQQL
jgi:hypothetical protein